MRRAATNHPQSRTLKQAIDPWATRHVPKDIPKRRYPKQAGFLTLGRLGV
jgi:hypothetical protein